MKIIQMTGKKFGKLKVIGIGRNNKWRKTMWLCKCDCGKKVEVIGTELRSGHTTSCGCYRKEKSSQLHTTHGLSTTRLHRIWIGLRVRCLTPKHHSYKRYGAVGIKVCKRWDKFENFIADMGASYKIHCKKFGERETSLDRVNPYGNYTPKNCRWATQKVQANNRRK